MKFRSGERCQFPLTDSTAHVFAMSRELYAEFSLLTDEHVFHGEYDLRERAPRSGELQLISPRIKINSLLSPNCADANQMWQLLQEKIEKLAERLPGTQVSRRLEARDRCQTIRNTETGSERGVYRSGPI